MDHIYFISIMFIINTSLSATFFDTFCAFFGKTPYQTTIKIEYPLAPNGALTIANIDGNVTVQSNPHLHHVVIYATKHAAIKEHLEYIDIIKEEVTEDTITLRTSYAQDHIKGCVEYIISAPCNTHLDIVTGKGNITINNLEGKIRTKTELGNIDIHEANSRVDASVAKRGNITVIGAQEELNLATNRGSILVLQSRSAVAATTGQGNITITCSKLAQEILARSLQGNVTVYLPAAINARIHAQTTQGTITSELPISIESITTTLDKSYWQKVKQEVHGHIGDEPKATITVTTQKGNILLGQ